MISRTAPSLSVAGSAAGTAARAAAPARPAHRAPAGAAREPGFSLIEVLIAIVVLGLGLLGLAAVFPAVISQQRNATDRIQGEIVAETAMATLDSSPDIADWSALLADPRWPDLGGADSYACFGGVVPRVLTENGVTYAVPAAATLWHVGTDGDKPGVVLVPSGDLAVRSFLAPRQAGFDPSSDAGGSNWPGVGCHLDADGIAYMAGGSFEGFTEPLAPTDGGTVVEQGEFIPASSRLIPPPYSGRDPVYVWDALARRTPDNQVEVAIFIRRINPLRLPRGTSVSDALTSGSHRPVSENGDGTGNYSTPLMASAAGWSDNSQSPPVVRTDVIRIAAPDLGALQVDGAFEAGDDQLAQLASAGQKFVDNLGVVRSVTEVARDENTGDWLLTVTPPYSRDQVSSTLPAARSLRQIVFTPEPPAQIMVRRMTR